MIRQFIAATALAVISAASSAATITWTGAVNSDWSNAGNWDLGRAPQTGDDVVLANTGAHPTNYDLVGVTLHSISRAVGVSISIGPNPIAFQSGGSITTGSTDVFYDSPVTLNGPATFTGPNRFDAIVSGVGPLTLNRGTLVAVNTYTGGTVSAPAFGSVRFVVNGSAPTAGALAATTGLTTFFSSSTIGSLSGAGTVSLFGTLTVGGDNTSTTFSGILSGAGGSLTKTGAGTMTLSGASTYPGTTTVNSGRLNVTGSIASPAIVSAGATLGGTGTIGNSVAVSSGGTLAPGVAAGILSTGNLALAAGSLFSVQLNGTTAGSQYDQLNVTGTVDLSGATLNASLGYAPAVGHTFTIVLNDGADAVIGTFSGLAEGAVFTIGASPVRISYSGGDGNDVALAVVSAPAAPTIGAATPGNGQAQVGFTPGSDGGTPITGYTVTCNPGAITAGGAASPVLVTGLANGTAYTCSVTATNAVGTSAPSSTVSVTPFTVPGAPTIGVATPGDAQATIAFAAPASSGGSAITGYTVTCNPGAITGTGAASPVVVSGLANGTAYTCTVTATNLAGTGPASATVSVTPFTVPAAPLIGAATPGNGEAQVGFTPGFDGGSPITGYTATCNPGAFVSAGAASPLTVSGLANGTTYTCSVTATNAAGTSAASATVSVTPVDVPGAPTIGAATPGNAQATIAFTAPASTGGSAITGYTATCNPGAITGTGAASPIVVTGLANGTAYTCSVTATNSAGTGLPSATVSVTPFTVPGAPTIGAATPGNAQAAIAFTAPASDGGSAITGYAATCNPGAFVSAGAASPLAVAGLANGTTYTCSVTATNAAGAGPASGTASVTPSFNTFSAPSATGTGTITASFTGGGAACVFSTPAFIGAPPGTAPVPPTAPAATSFPHGLFDFRTVGCTPGATVTFTVTYPVALPFGTQYWKYGPTPGDPTPHWYVLPATIAGNTATFAITDGGLGDDDVLANGTIVDQGGPGVPVAGPPVQTPTLSQWALALMALLLAMSGMLTMHRRARG